MDATCIQVNPTSLPHPTRGHGVIITLRETAGSLHPTSVFVDRAQAVRLRDLIDRALEKGTERC